MPFVWTHSTLDPNVRKVTQKDHSTDLEILLWCFLNICFMSLVIAAFRYALSCPDVITVNAGYVMEKYCYIYETTDPFNLSFAF